MEERITIIQNNIYKSNLNEGIITFMALLTVDPRIPILLSKETIIKIVIDNLKKLENASFPDIAAVCEKELTNILPGYDFKQLRELIIAYYIVEQTTPTPKIPAIKSDSITSKKVLNYLNEQLYINVLNCVYDLMLKAAKLLSMDRFSKKIMVGKKTCEALYPEFEFDDAIEILAEDVQTWINYNLLNVFCKIEYVQEGLYIIVEI